MIGRASNDGPAARGCGTPPSAGGRKARRDEPGPGHVRPRESRRTGHRSGRVPQGAEPGLGRRRIAGREQCGEGADQTPVALGAPHDEQSLDVPVWPRRCLVAWTFASRPRMTAPPSRMRSQISTTATSRRTARVRRTSMDRGREPSPATADSGSDAQPPGADVATTRFWRRRCWMSRGRSAPGTLSKKAASCSPSVAAQAAQVSIPVSTPWPPSSFATSGCETPARTATSRWRSPAPRRASRRPTPNLLATTAARTRPAIT